MGRHLWLNGSGCLCSPVRSPTRYFLERKKIVKKFLCFGLLLLILPIAAQASQSYYPARLDDPAAVYLTKDNFPVHADGIADDSAAIQAAIDKVEDEHGEGILFVPEGKYRITRTIYVWPSVRIIGYGATRPEFLLADNTPGYQHDIGYMFFFTGGRPGGRHWHWREPNEVARPPFAGTVPPTNSVVDANPGTFYSAMSNVDFDLGERQSGRCRDPVPCRAALLSRPHRLSHQVRSHRAQGRRKRSRRPALLRRRLRHHHQKSLRPDGSSRCSIPPLKVSAKPPSANTRPASPSTTTPSAMCPRPSISIRITTKSYGSRTRGSRTSAGRPSPSAMRTIRAPRSISKTSPAITCPPSPLLRGSGQKTAGPAEDYVVKSYSHGLTIPAPGQAGEIGTSFDAHPVHALPAEGDNIIRSLPPIDTWVNLRTLGVKGDGVSDDTAAIQKAIDEHRALYIPEGRYIVSNTIHLKPDTVLIGLHPSMTQFDILDGTAAFQGPARRCR